MLLKHLWKRRSTNNIGWHRAACLRKRLASNSTNKFNCSILIYDLLSENDNFWTHEQRCRKHRPQDELCLSFLTCFNINRFWPADALFQGLSDASLFSRWNELVRANFIPHFWHEDVSSEVAIGISCRLVLITRSTLLP